MLYAMGNIMMQLKKDVPHHFDGFADSGTSQLGPHKFLVEGIGLEGRIWSDGSDKLTRTSAQRTHQGLEVGGKCTRDSTDFDFPATQVSCLHVPSRPSQHAQKVMISEGC